MNKKDLRAFIRMQKGMFTPQQLDEQSAVVIRRLMAHPRVKNAGCVLMYYSLDDEVNTHEAVDLLLKQGKRVLLPAVSSATTPKSTLPSSRAWLSTAVATGWGVVAAIMTGCCLG